MPTFAVDGVRLHYEEHGDGDEVVVLLHGFTTSLVGNWQRTGWIDLLAGNGFRVLTLDFRSHGRSDRIYEPSTCDAALLARDVVALLDQVQLPRASIFGFSMGGGVALQLAIDHPERVTGLVLGGVGDAAINALHDSDELSNIIAAFAAQDALPDPTTPWRLRRIAEREGNDPKALIPFLRCGGWPGGLAETRPITAPTLIIIAEHDQYMNATEAIRRWLAPAEIITITGRDHHDVLLDDRVRTAVTLFLKHLGERADHPSPGSQG